MAGIGPQVDRRAAMCPRKGLSEHRSDIFLPYGRRLSGGVRYPLRSAPEITPVSFIDYAPQTRQCVVSDRVPQSSSDGADKHEGANRETRKQKKGHLSVTFRTPSGARTSHGSASSATECRSRRRTVRTNTRELTERPENKKGHFSVTFRTPSGARTLDPNIKSVVLYQLS